MQSTHIHTNTCVTQADSHMDVHTNTDTSTGTLDTYRRDTSALTHRHHADTQIHEDIQTHMQSVCLNFMPAYSDIWNDPAMIKSKDQNWYWLSPEEFSTWKEKELEGAVSAV